MGAAFFISQRAAPALEQNAEQAFVLVRPPVIAPRAPVMPFGLRVGLELGNV